MRSFDGNRQDIMYPFMAFQELFSIYTIFKGYKLKKTKGGCAMPELRRMRRFSTLGWDMDRQGERFVGTDTGRERTRCREATHA
jgi:hypothetical protein